MAGGGVYESKNESGVKILKITGDFTKDTVPELQNICYAIGKGHGTKGILLDFQEVSDIDTSAFACVINFIKNQLGRGISVGILNLNNQEKALAEILKISNVIGAFETESEAVAELSK